MASEAAPVSAAAPMSPALTGAAAATPSEAALTGATTTEAAHPSSPTATTGTDGLILGLSARLIGALCRQRRVVLPLVLAFTLAAAFLAVRVEAAFDVQDFFSSHTDFVVSLDKLDEHVGELGGEPTIFLIEADLSDPAVIAVIDQQFARLDGSGSTRFARDAAGGLIVSDSPADLSAATLASTAAIARVASVTGVALTDDDLDGIADTPQQLTALFAVAATEGISLDEDRLRYTADEVRQIVWRDQSAPAAARISIQLPGTRAVETIAAAQDELTPFLESFNTALRAADPNARVALTGGPFTRQASLDATYRALQRSLPIAIVLCFLVVALAMRSIRYAVASIVPILLVVAWLYAFMYIAGFTLNLVTATIGAISIGVGIDYAIHYTMRFREELTAHPPVHPTQRTASAPAIHAAQFTATDSRIDAAQRAAASTGSALIGSALSSVIGFAVMSFAPMPLFATYGLLTAVMIMLSATAALMVLPPLLVLIAPRGRPI